MSERKRALQRLRLRTKEKISFPAHSYEFYSELRHTLRPLRSPRWVTLDEFKVYFGTYYTMIDIDMSTRRILIAPVWMMPFRVLMVRVRRSYWTALGVLLRKMQKHGIVDVEEGVRPHWKWLWEGYKRARAKKKG